MTVRPCIEPGCPRKTSGTRCPEHEAQRQAKRNAEPHRRVYRHPRWQQARWLTLARDGYRCRAVVNGKQCEHIDPTGRTLHAHHTVPIVELLANGLDPFNPDVLVTLCRDHHAAADAQRRRRAAAGRTHAAMLARAKAKKLSENA